MTDGQRSCSSLLVLREAKKSWLHVACAKDIMANGMLVGLAQLCEFIPTGRIAYTYLLYLVAACIALGARQTGG